MGARASPRSPCCRAPRPAAEVILPNWAVTEGTITRFKKVGDAVAADEALFEVSTRKRETERADAVARRR